MVNELTIKYALNFLAKVKLSYNREKSPNMVIKVLKNLNFGIFLLYLKTGLFF